MNGKRAASSLLKIGPTNAPRGEKPSWAFVGPIFRRLLAQQDHVGLHCLTVLTLTLIGRDKPQSLLYRTAHLNHIEHKTSRILLSEDYLPLQKIYDELVKSLLT